ncbi:MAG: purine phosphorylase [Alphaproteobacteria bacterium]|jgi:adenosylhomocysteine nucleosidase|nr:purine phosphorylase [Alphaproteobacteria bacterium]
MTRLGVITGLASEAACLEAFASDARPIVRCAGANSARAGVLAGELIEEGCDALLSFGTAGGLAMEQRPGAIVVASRIIAPDGQGIETSKTWRDGVVDVVGQGAGVTVGAMAGAAAGVATPTAKAELGQATGAIAVDMESHAIATVAEDAGVDFLVIRAIADPVEHAIPGWVLGNISEKGQPRIGPILAGLVMHPWDLPALMRLRRDSDLAHRSLSGVAGRLGPLFGLG